MKVNCNLIANSGDSPIMCKGEANLTNNPTEGLVHDVYEKLPGTWTFSREEGINQVGASTEFTYDGSYARLTFQASLSFLNDVQETRHFLAVFKNGVLQTRTISECFIFFQALEQRNIDLTATVLAASGDIFELFIKAVDEPVSGPSNITLENGSFIVTGGS